MASSSLLKLVVLFIVSMLILGKAVTDDRGCRSFGKNITNLPTECGDELVPWQVGLYVLKNVISGKHELICGGTLMSSDVIITAAHCIQRGDNITLQPENLEVGFGKLTGKNHSITSKVKTIEIPPGYEGNGNQYFADIALLKLAKPVEIKDDRIRPACLDLNQKVELKAGERVMVSGWGPLKRKDERRVDKKLKCVKMELKVCADASNTIKNHTKICTKGVQAANSTDTSFKPEPEMTRGDAGGGLIVQQQGQPFLIGVVSHKLLGERAPTVSTHIRHPDIEKWLKEQWKKLKGSSTP